MFLSSRRFEWGSQIWPNTTAQCTFCTARHTFCTVKNQLFTLKNKKVGKSVKSARGAVVKCALCSGVRSDLSARFKRPRKEKLMLRVSLKLLKNWRNCRQMCFRACLRVSPFNSLAFKFLFRSCLSILWLEEIVCIEQPIQLVLLGYVQCVP